MPRTGTQRLSPAAAKAHAAKAKKSPPNNENQSTVSGNVSTPKQARGRKDTANAVNALQVFNAIANNATATIGTPSQALTLVMDTSTQANGGGPGAATAAATTANQAAGSNIDPELLANSIQTLQDELREAKAALAVATAAVAANPGGTPPGGTPPGGNGPPNPPIVAPVVARIARPHRGSSGHGFNLQREMGLDGDPAKYRAIRRTLKAIADAAQLDHRTIWRHQPKDVIGRVLRLARKREPYLGRFIHDWATEEYLKSHLKNKRQYQKRMKYGQDDDADIDVDSDGEGGESGLRSIDDVVN